MHIWYILILLETCVFLDISIDMLNQNWNFAMTQLLVVSDFNPAPSNGNQHPEWDISTDWFY